MRKIMMVIFIMAFVFNIAAADKGSNKTTKDRSYNLLEEGFESGSCPPAGWRLYDAEGATENWYCWDFSHDGFYGMRSYPFYNSDAWLVTPQLSVTAEGELSFWSWLAKPTLSTVLISTGSPDPADGDYELVLDMPDLGSGWEEMTVDLTPFTGQEVYVAFRGRNMGSGLTDWTIDDVTVTTEAAMGFVSGNIAVDGVMSVTMVEVSTGNHTIHPDSDGNYSMILAPGNYDVAVSLYNHEPVVLNGIAVTDGVTSENNNATLKRFAPQNPAVDGEHVLSWEEPQSEAEPAELAYDDGEPAYAENTAGRKFGTRISPEGPCKILALYFATYAESDSVAFDATIQGWDGSAPTDEQLFSEYNVPAVPGGWSEIDLSSYEIHVDGDFVPCLQAWMPVAIYSDPDIDSGRTWYGHDVPWTAIPNTLFIRATVMYEDGRVAEVSSNTKDENFFEKRGLTGYEVYLDGASVGTTSDLSYTFENLTGGQSYTAGVKALHADGSSSDLIEMDFIPNGINDNNLVCETALNGNYPNPFNPETTINFSLANKSDVTLAVYDAMGRKVTELVNSQMKSGHHNVKFSGANLASGVYYYNLKAEGKNFIKKMMLVK